MHVEPQAPAKSIPEPWPPGATTVIVQNIPSRCSHDTIFRLFTPDGSYDMLCLPYSIKQRRPCGYCFVNFLTPRFAQQFCEYWHGRSVPFKKDAVLSALPARVQGYEVNLENWKQQGVEGITNDEHLPSLLLCGTQAAAFAAALPDAVLPAASPGWPQRLDFRMVLASLPSDDTPPATS